jgi:hypothetical protein
MNASKWAEILERKKDALSKAKIPTSMETQDFDQFEKFLERLCTQYTSKGASKFVRERLAPSFEHVKSFAAAINSATQSMLYASVIWGGLQVVLEVRSSRHYRS